MAQPADTDTQNMGKSNNIAAIVVCYHPESELLRTNVGAFAGDVERVLVWRNSADDLGWLKEEFGNVEFMGDGENAFIARPLNEALRYCANKGYKWLLTMDQDSVFEDFAAFKKDILNREESDVAVYAPNVNNLYCDCDDHKAETVITSGSVIDVEKALETGGFKEKYEIYWVDGEYCYRARKSGYKIIVTGRHHLKQQFGRQTRTLFGFETSNYSAPIYYRLIRNMLWEHREHGSKAVSLRCIAHTLIFTTRGIALGEKQKFRKLSAIAKGLWHGTFKSYK